MAEQTGYVHELPGTARHDRGVFAEQKSRWLDHQMAARELCSGLANTFLIVEHEYPMARIQDGSGSSQSFKALSPSLAR